MFFPFRIIKNNSGTAPLTYKKFLAIVQSLGCPEHPCPTLNVHFLAGCCTPVSEDHEEKFGVPSLKELGLDVSKLSAEVWHGGETEALIRLDRHLERKVQLFYLTYIIIRTFLDHLSRVPNSDQHGHAINNKDSFLKLWTSQSSWEKEDNRGRSLRLSHDQILLLLHVLPTFTTT